METEFIRISDESAGIARAMLNILIEHATDDGSAKSRLQRSRIYSGSREEREAITHALWRLGRVNWGGIQAGGLEAKCTFVRNSGGADNPDSLRGFGPTEQHYKYELIAYGLYGDKEPITIISFFYGDNGAGVTNLVAINEEEERWRPTLPG